MDKKLLAQLNDRYNDFVLQETEILELLRRTIGLPNPTIDCESKTNYFKQKSTLAQKTETDSEASQIMKEIAEVNAKLAKVRAKNIELEKEAASKDLNVAIKERDRLSQRGGCNIIIFMYILKSTKPNSKNIILSALLDLLWFPALHLFG